MERFECGPIKVLAGVEPARKRPGMYVGDTADGSGMHRMLWWLVQSMIDGDASATYVRVQVDGDELTIEDDGPGLPIDTAPDGRPMVEILFTTLHGMFALTGYPVASALSACLDVEVWRGGRRYRQRFERGVAVTPLWEAGSATRTGTRIRLVPDFTIFDRFPWDLRALSRHARDQAVLHPGLAFLVQGRAFRAPAGLADHARHLGRRHRAIHRDPLHVSGTRDGIGVDAAFLWTDGDRLRTAAFVNQDRVPTGSHRAGLHDGVRDALERLAPDRLRGVYPAAFREVVAPGLVALVRVEVDIARYGDYRRRRLTMPEVRAAVRAVVADGLAAALDADRALLGRLLARMPA